MKLRSLSSSSTPVRFLAAARSDSSASMNPRPHYRGGRYHNYRGYCDRSGFGEGHNIDPSQGRGRGWNTVSRQVDGGGYVDNRSYNNASSGGQFSPRLQFQQSRPPYYHGNQGFNGRTGSYNAPMNNPGSIRGNSYGSVKQPVYVQQQQGQPNQYRPRNSKPLDFREWEHAKPEPPHHWERFTILSYNILADYLATDHWRKLYFHIPRHMLSWEWRKNSLLFELRLWSPDIMCLQEVDRFEDLDAEFKRQGYDGIYKRRTGYPVDGCSIFWRASKFKLLHEESIEFNQLGLRDNVAQICVLESFQQSQRKNPSALDTSSSSDSNRVVVCNIHVLFNPKRGDIKLGQVRVLFDKAYAVSKTWNNAPVVVCGDFNCTPKSPLYNYILEQKLDLSGLMRDKVSGQTSAEIRAPIFYSPNPGVQVPVNIETSTGYARLNSNVERSGSHLDYQNQITTSGTTDNLQGQPQHIQSDEATGRGTPGGGPSSVDVDDDDVLNAPKNTPPLHYGLDAASLKSNKIEAKNGIIEDSIPYGDSSDEIAPLDPSIDGIINTENSIPLWGEKTGNFTVASNSATSDASTNFEIMFEDPAKLVGEPKDTGEDGETFLSELTRDSLNLDYNQYEMTGPVKAQQVHGLSPESEPFSPEKNTYDPSIWTRTEIETATGSADCTSLEHPLKLSSTYSETEDLLGTRDAYREPLITSYHRCFCGTVDYIWRSEGLRTVKVLSPLRKQAMQWTAGFPTKKWGSDHIALVAQLAFVEVGS